MTLDSGQAHSNSVAIPIQARSDYGLVDRPSSASDGATPPPADMYDMLHRAEQDVMEYAKHEAEVLLRRIPLGDGSHEFSLESHDKQREPLLDEAKAHWTSEEEQRKPRREHLQSVGLAALAFSRSMIGTAALYLPRMFYTGGLGFSSVVLVLVAMVSTYNMVVLSEVHDRVGAHSFGGLGRAAFGRFGEHLVDCIICLTQVGWVSGYLIFVQENVSAALPGLESALHLPPRVGLIVLQLLVLIPLSWVRRLAYLGIANFCAQVCVMLGLVICIGYSSSVLIERGGPAPFHWVNTQDCALFLGSIAITFEGMSLTLPIKRSMREPQHFAPMVCVSMACLCLLFFTVGAVGYLAFGDDNVQTFATNNLPTTGALGPTVRIAYSVAVLLTYPLQLFPATALLEKTLFDGVDVLPSKRKLLKNLFRSFVVALTCLIAVLVGSKFDNFAAIIGALGSVPLALILAPAIHLKLCSKDMGKGRRVLESLIVTVGIAIMVLSATVTILTWI